MSSRAMLLGERATADGGPPVTVGTAGHVDHGKTALVAALTGVNTDRLPQERERGLSIELGFAALDLPCGRRASLVDVPGHERFVRTMVAGATGIDLFLLVVAANDGVMPQTREHLQVLRGLDVRNGAVAVTKADLADPYPAAVAATQLLDAPEIEVVACSARTGAGVAALRDALGRAAERTTSRADDRRPPLLHVDRAFTIRGAGSVATGTLWSGALHVGEQLVVLPGGRRARVRGLQVHDAAVERAQAGQRVAVNLVGVPLAGLERGIVLAAPDAGVETTWILDATLALADLSPPRRVHVHHGTRETPARLVALGGDAYQLRCEQPLLARRGDRVVIRAIAPPGTLGGGMVTAPRARHRGPGTARASLPSGAKAELVGAASQRAPAGSSASSGDEPAVLPVAALALERQLRAAGHEPPLDSELGADAVHLPVLRAAGRAVRLGPAMHAHPQALAAVREQVTAIIRAEGSVTVARLRDELDSSRKYALALLEHCDKARLTLRLPDDRRVLRGCR